MPSNTPTATGQPSAAHNRTWTICNLPFLPSPSGRSAPARSTDLEPGQGDVIEHKRTVLEVAAGERGLDRALARAEPVERTVELDLVDRAERAQREQPAQARTGGLGGKLARGGELGDGRDQ